MLMHTLDFDESRFTVETVTEDNITVVYRAFENISYVENPVDEETQKLSIYVPEAFYQGQKAGRYDDGSAPIVIPNTVGGYMPGFQERPGIDHKGLINIAFYALHHGCVVVSPGIRGRGSKDAAGNYAGCAPACVVDLKAVIRYLRHNRNKLPGDTDHIITSGTSAGGALSALAGVTGNHPDYEPYLEELGAARERDDIFAASCYCPITDLEHADMAYEWEFRNETEYHGIDVRFPAGGGRPARIPFTAQMTEEEKKWSEQLAASYPAYIRQTALVDEEGRSLTLDADGSGTFRDFIIRMIEKSAEEEIAFHKASARIDRTVPPEERNKVKRTEPEELPFLDIDQEGRVKLRDFGAFTAFRTRMKPAPAFDSPSLQAPENELFGSQNDPKRHFTAFSHARSKVSGQMADEGQIRRMNPLAYISDDKAVKAPHFRIRHGAADRDTSLAVSAVLALKLKEAGLDADFFYPWGITHAGDYDLEDWFAWLDAICLPSEN
jgi:acetyl esterase/lipase